MKKVLIFVFVLFTMTYADIVLKWIHKNNIKNIDFCKDYLLTASKNKIKIWDLKKQELKYFIESSYIDSAKFGNNCNIYYLKDYRLYYYDMLKKNNISLAYIPYSFFISG